MPEPTPTGAVDLVERQVRRVRRRKNSYELQRTIYLAIAAAAGVATVLLPCALFASTRVFATVAVGALALAAGIAMALAGGLHRRWLGRERTLGWIEAHGGLGGRVRTLLELVSRRGAPGFFHALLVSQVSAGLADWTPRRLVPRRIPRAAGAMAVIAIAVLAVAFRLAALALPAAPTLGTSDRPLVAERPDGPVDPMAGERLVVAPGVPAGRGEQSAPATADDRDDPSTLTQLSSAFQENVRQQIWGKAWERVRDALARAGTTGGSGGTRDEAGERAEELDGEGAGDWEVARAPGDERDRRHDPGTGRKPSEHDDATAGDTEATANDRAPEADANEHDGRDGNSGAGNGTSPDDLFGGSPVDTEGGGTSFELSLAARMRSDRVGRRGAPGPAPDADPDARPALASEQRNETAAHRMAVPAAYEQVVREVFAHREEP